MSIEAKDKLLRRGFHLEYLTLGWNVLGVFILAVAALRSHSIALVAFGLDSLIEIGASIVVVWELRETDGTRSRRALRLIGFAFISLAIYVSSFVTYSIVVGHHPRHSIPGIVWTSATFVVMSLLAWRKATTGRALQNEVLQTEGRVTRVDAYLAAAVLVGLGANAIFGWWWADPIASMVIVFYAIREALVPLSQS